LPMLSPCGRHHKNRTMSTWTGIECAKMRIFATSDLHLDYSENARGLSKLLEEDYRQDVLIVAGDVAHSLRVITWSFNLLAKCFKRVLYVPGNHDLWVVQRDAQPHSWAQYHCVSALAQSCGISVGPLDLGALSIVPLLSWYDYSFGEPDEKLIAAWMDYRACKWPEDSGVGDITRDFLARNTDALKTRNTTIISFSHFVPRLDLVARWSRSEARFLLPVLGTALLEPQIRSLRPLIHVYGHSHVNQNLMIDGITYVNNAFGYPHETRFAAKRLICVHQVDDAQV
jgi:predicted phosphodiesterase